MSDIDAPADAIVNQHLLYALALQATLLPSLVELEGFAVESVAEESRDGKRFALVKYKYEPKNPPKKVFVRSGKVHLLVDHYWLVDSAEFSIGIDNDPSLRWQFTVKNRYNFDDFSIPVPVSSEWKCFDNTPDRTWRYSITREFRFRKTEDRSKDRFTLSAFGLPEPDFGAGPSRHRLWFVIANTILVGVVLFWVLWKRRA